MNDLQRTPPRDNGAETQLIGCCLMQPTLVEECGDIVEFGHFSNHRLAILWDAMRALYAKHGTFDVAMIYSWLKEAKLFDRAGGPATVGACLDLVGTTVNAAKYAQRIRDYARRRSIIGAANDIVVEGYEETIEDVEAWAVKCEQTLVRASSNFSSDTERTASDAMTALHRHVMTDEPDEETGPPLLTHFPTFNDEFSIGGCPRKLIVVMGRPGMGKTSWTMNLTSHWLEHGAKGGFFSMEMKEREIAGRYAAMVGGVPYRTIVNKKKALNREQLDAFLSAGEKIRTWNLLYDFETALTVSQITSRAMRMKRRLGGLDFIVVDHFHKMNHGLTGHRRDDSQMAISSGGLMDLANNLDCVVLMLAQLSRKCEDRADKKPIISDARECGAIEQDAQYIVSPFWPWYYRKSAGGLYGSQVERTNAELLILKNRDGSTGEIPLHFHPEHVQYRERE